MARRRTKKRTHVGAQNKSANGVPANSLSREPKSMVIRIGAGEVGSSVSQLARDVRNIMEPDYTAMVGPLGVTHLLLFSRSSTGNTNLRLALTPRGPTLHFRVEQYALSKDVQKAQKRPRGGGKEYLTPPLLVMNNFSTPPPADGSQPHVPKHLESLTTTIFQSLFPPISPAITPLSSIRRVLLLNREVPKKSTESKHEHEGSYILNFRHYIIETKRAGLSQGIKRLNVAEKLNRQSKNNRSMPNLGKLDDVADYLLDPSLAASGFTSASESGAESDAKVEVLANAPRKVLSKAQMGERREKGLRVSNGGQPGVETRAVKLVESGPRMKLRMTKVEEGVCNGKVMWHEYMSKTNEEVKNMEKVWEKRRLEKEERKRVQKENVERKRWEKRGSTANGENQEQTEDNEDEELDDSEDEWDSE